MERGGILRGWVMKRQPLSAGAPEENNIGWMLGVRVQATNQRGFSYKKSLSKEICRWQIVFRRAGGWKGKDVGVRGGEESLKGLNNLHNFLSKFKMKMRLQLDQQRSKEHGKREKMEKSKQREKKEEVKDSNCNQATTPNNWHGYFKGDW